MVENDLRVLKSKDIQDLLGFGKTKMCELFQSGTLPVVKIGREYITTEKKLENWIEENIGKEIFF